MTEASKILKAVISASTADVAMAMIQIGIDEVRRKALLDAATIAREIGAANVAESIMALSERTVFGDIPFAEPDRPKQAGNNDGNNNGNSMVTGGNRDAS